MFPSFLEWALLGIVVRVLLESRVCWICQKVQRGFAARKLADAGLWMSSVVSRPVWTRARRLPPPRSEMKHKRAFCPCITSNTKPKVSYPRPNPERTNERTTAATAPWPSPCRSCTRRCGRREGREAAAAAARDGRRPRRTSSALWSRVTAGSPAMGSTMPTKRCDRSWICCTKNSGAR